MLRQIYAMTVKELKVLARDRGAAVVLFLMPIVFIFVMTSAGAGGVSSEDRPATFLVVNEDEGALAGTVVDELRALDGVQPVADHDGEPLSPAAAEALIADHEYSVAVIFPAGFSERVRDAAAETPVVTFIVDPAVDSRFVAPLQGTVAGLVERTMAAAQTPGQIAAAFREMAAEMPPEQAAVLSEVGEAFTRRLAGEGAPAGGQAVSFERIAPRNYVQDFPTAEEQNVPAYTLFGVFFIIQIVSTSLLDEKHDGTFRRLLASPMPRGVILVGKLMPYYLVNLAQVVLMFGVGVVVFDMSLGSSLSGLILVTLATAATAAGLGLLLAALGRTRERVNALGALLSIVLAALGGIFIPTFAMAEWMQPLSRLTPHAWALTGYQDVIVRGLEASAVLEEVAALLLFAAVFYAIALWQFRFEG